MRKQTNLLYQNLAEARRKINIMTKIHSNKSSIIGWFWWVNEYDMGRFFLLRNLIFSMMENSYQRMNDFIISKSKQHKKRVNH